MIMGGERKERKRYGRGSEKRNENKKGIWFRERK
jgi:hypothetical protein